MKKAKAIEENGSTILYVEHPKIVITPTPEHFGQFLHVAMENGQIVITIKPTVKCGGYNCQITQEKADWHLPIESRE